MIVRFVKSSPTWIGAAPLVLSRCAEWCSIIAAAKISRAVINDFATEVSES